MKLSRRGCWLLCMLLFGVCVSGSSVQAQNSKKEQGQSEAAKHLKGLPLKATRTVEFDTDEGTWVSLDVSPDGKTIIFDLLGHLYSMPLQGGQATAVTHGLGYDREPRFSPDGRKIVFISDRNGADNLWIANPDGSDAKPLTTEEHTLFVSPSWTHDGEYILVSRKKPAFYDATFELWMYDAKGGSGVQVTRSKPHDDTPPDQWHNALGAVASPDGRFIYYARKHGYFSDNIKFPLWQVARRDRNTGEEEVITNAPGSGFRPVLSPEGNLLVYATRYDSRTGLRIRNFTTGEDRWLKYPVQRDDQESYFATADLLPGYAFLPDGKEIVISYGGKIHRLNVQTGEDQPIPFQARVSRELGPRLYFPARVGEGPVQARLIQGAVQAPGGKQLAFSALTHLYIMDLPKGTPRRLTTGMSREYQPAWSPDGQWLAFVSWSNQGGHIWKIRADGQGAAQQLTRTPAYYRDPVWSPDGKEIIALREDKLPLEEGFTGFANYAGLDLISVSSQGGDATLISPGRGYLRPHFGQETDRVYVTRFVRSFLEPKANVRELVSMRFDGTDRRTLIKLKGKDVWGADVTPKFEIVLSPDGQHALVLYRGHLYVFEIPRIGGEPPVEDISSPSLPVKRLSAADYCAWADGGKTITWSVGASFFRLPLADIKFEIPAEAPGAAADEAGQAEAQSIVEPGERTAEEIPVVIEQPRYTPQGVIALRGARVITMRGDEVLQNADVVITNNRITGVGRRGAIRIPHGATLIDVRGDTIVPGFIDTHAHWSDIHRDVLDLQNWDFLASLAYGITAGRDPQTFTDDIFAYQDLGDTGDILGPRAYSTGPGIFWVNDFQSEAEAEAAELKYKKYYRTNLLKSYLVGNRRQREFVVQAAQKLQMMPTTEGAADLDLDLTHAIDGFSGVEHQFPIVPLYKDVVDLVAQSGIFYTPTFIIDGYGGPGSENYFYETSGIHDDSKVRRFIPHNVIDEKMSELRWYRKDQYDYPQEAAAAAAIIRAGGRVCVGGHGEFQGLSFHWELWSLQSGGLSNLEALRSATLAGAEAIGKAQDLGSIEPGKLADLVVLGANPLENIRNTTNIRYVMKNGELFQADTLDEIWPQKKPLQPLWWWKDHP